MKAFECKRCGECCYGEGGIYVLEHEVHAIARFLGVRAAEFLSRFCEERNGRTYLRTGLQGWCIFFDREKRCLVHPVKPGRCVQWPYFDAMVSDEENWELAKGACPGINPDASHRQFVREAEETGFAAGSRRAGGK